MGCCGSTQAGDNDLPPSSTTPAPQPTTITSRPSPIAPLVSSHPSRAPASTLLQIPSTPQTDSQSPSRSSTPLQPTTPRLNLPERYNSPLSPPSPWTSTSKTWSPATLHRERQEFFETRVTGRPEIWGALQNVCELVRGGDVATGQGILDAAGITLPTGNLVDGCYDEAGNLYRLPEVVVSDPVNIAKGGEGEDARIDGSRNSHNIDGETMIGVPDSKMAVTPEEKVLDGAEAGDSGTDDREMQERRLEEKGKESERDAVKVKCRLSDRGGPDVVITLGKTQHVATLVKRVQMEANVPPPFRIRLAYLGKILSEKETLAAQGWKEGHVINALVVGSSAAAQTLSARS